MMKPVQRIDATNACASEGTISIDPKKATWNLSMISLAVVLAPITFSWDAFTLFFVATYFSLLVGHSVGMHRLMIHRTFETPKWISRILIYIGVLVGMAGPFGVIRIHDQRDWAQRQNECHDFFSHRRSFFLDLWWQLTSKFNYAKPPKIIIEKEIFEDSWFMFLEKTWRYHQLLLAIPLYIFGGWAWVVWGIFVRVSVSVVGHWSITYFCHNPGPGKWRVKEAYVQASNIPGLGVATYGECWHNNHHAFPESAQIGIEKGQCDPGWRFIQILNHLNLANNIRIPRAEVLRDDLKLIG